MMIAIDGPAGSGKSTIAKRIARLRNLTYIDTGAMYRALTYDLMGRDIAPDDDERIAARLDSLVLDFSNGHMMLDGIDISEEIRSPEVTGLVSDYAKNRLIRLRMQDYQRQIALSQPVIMDGRDIGTVVLPDAELKIFLTASVEERASRRVKDFEEKGFPTTLEEQIAEIERRDHIDSNRAMSPLRKADDAHVIDTSLMTIQEVINRILELYDEVSHVPVS